MEKVFTQVPQSIVEQAISWYLQINAAQTDSDLKAKFDEWISQDASHAKAYERIEKIFRPLDGVDAKAAGKSIASVLKTDHKLTKRKNIHGIAFSIILLIATYIGLQTSPAKVVMADNKTEIGEIKTIVLPDQSKLTMNTNTALDVAFDQQQRIIKLYKGEVFVDVSKDASRPFLVITEHGDAEALGTQFNVNLENGSTHIAMIESKVKACNQPSAFSHLFSNASHRKCTVLYPGQGINITNDSIGNVSDVDVNTISGWVNGSIVIDNQPLPTVLAQLQRYSQAEIIFSIDELNHIKVSGVLPVNNIPHAFEILANQFNLQINQVDLDTIQISSQ
ncbi:MAG: FecR family protein [Methylophilaceae bacterium]